MEAHSVHARLVLLSPHVVQCYILCCILVVLDGLVVDVNVPLLSCWGGGERGREGDGGADCVGWGGQKRRGGNVLARHVGDEKKKDMMYSVACG